MHANVATPLWQWYGDGMSEQKEFKQVTVSLRDTDIEKLDHWAQESHLPRSAVIRMMIATRWAETHKDK
jgi:hypothetical protein